MNKSLCLQEFVKLNNTESFYYTVKSIVESFNVLEENVLSRVRMGKELTLPEIIKAGNDAIELLKLIPQLMNNNNIPEAQAKTVELGKIYANVLVPYSGRTAQLGEIKTIVRDNLTKLEDVVRRNAATGRNTEKFVPQLGKFGPTAPAPQVDYDKAANVGSGILGANKVTYIEGKRK